MARISGLLMGSLTMLVRHFFCRSRLTVVSHRVTSNYHTSSEANPCRLFRDRDCRHEKGCFFFFFFFRMWLDATAGTRFAFLCAFRTLIDLLSLLNYLDRLKIHIIDFTIHHYLTVVITVPNKVSVVLSRPRGQIQTPYCCFPQYSLGM